jgi:hypothetical protein
MKVTAKNIGVLFHRMIFICNKLDTKNDTMICIAPLYCWPSQPLTKNPKAQIAKPE